MAARALELWHMIGGFMDEKLKARIKKLQALAERGVGGEKTTAQKKLSELLAKNNIESLQELLEDKEKYYLFSYNGKAKEKLLRQCMYKVLGFERWQSLSTYRSKGTRQKIGIYCTAAEKLEIELEFEFYSRVFDEELMDFVAAFISAQDIYPEDAPEANLEDYTPEELKKIKKQAAYSQGIEKRRRATIIEQQKEG